MVKLFINISHFQSVFCAQHGCRSTSYYRCHLTPKCISLRPLQRQLWAKVSLDAITAHQHANAERLQAQQFFRPGLRYSFTIITRLTSAMHKNTYVMLFASFCVCSTMEMSYFWYQFSQSAQLTYVSGPREFRK